MAANFIVLEPDPVVRMDIEGMLTAQYPTCHVEAGASLSEVGAAIYNCGPDSTLFVRGGMLTESDDLGRVLRAAATRHSQIVIIGETQELDFPARFVDPPFTSEMLLSAVRERCPDAQPGPAK